MYRRVRCIVLVNAIALAREGSSVWHGPQSIQPRQLRRCHLALKVGDAAPQPLILRL